MAIAFVAAGTAALSDGSDVSISPGLPAGVGSGHLMLCYAYTRDDFAGSISISSGWTKVFSGWSNDYDRTSGGTIGIWYRFWQSGDAAPTVTLIDYFAGITSIAQVSAFSGVLSGGPIGSMGTVSTNASQQNIGAITGFTSSSAGAVIVLGGKRAAWASVDTLSGDSLTWVEIGEPDTPVGDDAGLVWDYALGLTTSKVISDKTFTVAGGVSGAGKGVMFSLVETPTENLRSWGGGSSYYMGYVTGY